MGAGQHDLGALGRAPHLQDERAQPVARIVAFPGDLLALGKHRLRLANLQNRVALLDAMHHAAHDVPFLVGEFREDAVALGIAHPLENDLLRALRVDASELLWGQLLLQLIAQLGGGVEGRGLGQADLAAASSTVSTTFLRP